MASRKASIVWHYPRTALARRYLQTLDAGLISSLVLFAPRRKGLVAAHDAFVVLGRTPGLFHDAVERLMKAGGVDIEDVARHVLNESRQASGYAQRLMASLYPHARCRWRKIACWLSR